MKIKKISFNCLIGIIIFCFVITFTFAFFEINAASKREKFIVGKTVYIDAGHGGKDNGACVDSVLEDEINLKISSFLLEKLVDLGAYVLTSRSDDYDLASMYQKNRKREDLNNRVKYINNSKPDVFISIHLNTYPSNDVNGAQVFYQSNENSKSLAQFVQDELNVVAKRERKIKMGDYFILNNTNYLGILIECGFLSNNEERKKLVNSNYQEKIANRIKNGIINYFYEKSL